MRSSAHLSRVQVLACSSVLLLLVFVQKKKKTTTRRKIKFCLFIIAVSIDFHHENIKINFNVSGGSSFKTNWYSKPPYNVLSTKNVKIKLLNAQISRCLQKGNYICSSLRNFVCFASVFHPNLLLSNEPLLVQISCLAVQKQQNNKTETLWIIFHILWKVSC